VTQKHARSNTDRKNLKPQLSPGLVVSYDTTTTNRDIHKQHNASGSEHIEKINQSLSLTQVDIRNLHNIDIYNVI